MQTKTNTSNVKENIKYLINSPDELEKISETMFENADVNNTGYFTFDDVVTIFNVSSNKINSILGVGHQIELQTSN
jgi:hypothetical protein